MKLDPIFCPRCGSESDDETRFCRKCGANLQIINPPLADSRTAHQPAQSTKQSIDLLEELRRDIFWIAIRGIITLVIALPFFFLLILSTGMGGGVFTLLPSFVLLAFIALGIRDLSRAYSTFKDPHAALAALKAQEEEKQVEGRSELLESSVECDGNIIEVKNPPASITEHTTFPLKEDSKKPDASATKRFD